MTTKNTQFSELIQNELTRLETIMKHSHTPRTIYPVPQGGYAQMRRSSTLLKRQPSTYHGFLSLMRIVRIMSF